MIPYMYNKMIVKCPILCYNDIEMRKCVDCSHWKQTGEEDYQGHCGLYSITCINTINHPSFLTNDKVELVSEIRINQGEINKIKGTIAWIDTNSATTSRKKQFSSYPDMRQFTDESKKELRKQRRKK